MEEGLNCNTAPRRGMQRLNSSYKQQQQRRGLKEFFTLVTLLTRPTRGSVSVQSTRRSPKLHHPGGPGFAANRKGKLPTALWMGETKAGITDLSMEFSYFCSASSSWDALKCFMEKYVLLLH